MPTYAASVDSICFISGLDTSTGDVTRFIYMFPWLTWVGLGFFAGRTRDAYIQLLSSSYWLLSVVVTVIQELANQSHPHPACNTRDKAMPSWEAAMSFGLLTMMIFHSLIYYRKIAFFDVLGVGVFGASIPVVLGVTGNFTSDQIIIGAVVGLLVEGFFMVYVWLFWMERIILLTSRSGTTGENARLMGIWTYRDGLPSFYPREGQQQKPPQYDGEQQQQQQQHTSERAVQITADLYAGALSRRRKVAGADTDEHHESPPYA